MTGTATLARPLLTAGNFSIDDTVSPDGSSSTGPGGDALYSALGASLWGVATTIVSRIGTDYPADLLARLHSLGVGIDGVSVLPGPTVHYRIVNRPDGSREYEHLTEEARLDELCPQNGDLDQLTGARWVHVAAMPIDRQRAVIEQAWAAGVPYSLDPHEEYVVGYESVLAALVEGNWFAPSQLEVELLYPDLIGRPIQEMGLIASQRILDMGAGVAAIKLGADGSCVRSEDECWLVPALPVTVVDSVGAGDAYAGGLLAGYLSSGSLLGGAVCGTVSAAHVISGFGALHSPPQDASTLRDRLCDVLKRTSPPTPTVLARLDETVPVLAGSRPVTSSSKGRP